MQQRVRKRYRGKIPSSSGQLPVPVALNAELPTLFGLIIHDFTGFVNIFFPEFQLNSKLGFSVLLDVFDQLPTTVSLRGGATPRRGNLPVKTSNYNCT